MLFDYDRSSADSILHYARQLEGRTFLEVKREFNPDPETEDEEAQMPKASWGISLKKISLGMNQTVFRRQISRKPALS